MAYGQLSHIFMHMDGEDSRGQPSSREVAGVGHASAVGATYTARRGVPGPVQLVMGR